MLGLSGYPVESEPGTAFDQEAYLELDRASLALRVEGLAESAVPKTVLRSHCSDVGHYFVGDSS